MTLREETTRESPLGPIIKRGSVRSAFPIVRSRPGRPLIWSAKELNIPVKCWNRLQHGESVETPEGVYTPDMVMGEKRKGIKVTYCTDTRPTPAICEHGRETDLLILADSWTVPSDSWS